MLCVECGSELGPGSKFCAGCGARAAPACTSCGTPSGGGRFCSECGNPLPGAAPANRPPEQPVSERRLTSVLFGDLVGFTTLAEGRDPEDVREVLSRYFATARIIVERYGGTVEKFIGDAVMAVWGVPVAHEDDAERCVRAGLELVASMVALGDECNVPGLAMRVGVVTGEVAVTLGAVGEGMVAGDAVNTAARVQTAAFAGEVWVDDATRALTSAAVSYADAGEHALKGKAAPMVLFRALEVVASVGGVDRVDGLAAPFTGRDRELRLVKELFHAVGEDQQPRLVSVTGPPGVGKSRLGWEFEKYVDGISMTARWHRGRCLSYGEGVAFWAFAEMVRARIGAVESDPSAAVEHKLDVHLSELVADSTERAWLRSRLAALLGVAGTSASFDRQELFASWAMFLERLAVGGSVVVLVVEDVHHADTGLLDFLEYLLGRARFPLYVLTLGRPEVTEIRVTWGSGRRSTAVHLEPLPPAAMAVLVDGLVAGLPDDTRRALVERAEGIPLYAVETVRALVDRDAVVPRAGRYVLAEDAAARVDLATLGAPTSLQALIGSRLDALSAEERRVVQNASVLGLTFTAGGLAALAGVDDPEPVLTALVRKEIVFPDTDRWSAERGQYRFVQALVRTVAYETLSKRDRKARHLAVVAHLEQSADVEEMPSVLAAHYLAARDAVPGDPDADELGARAGALLEQAARRAARLGAPDEAQRHYQAALALTSDDAQVAALALAGCLAALRTADHEGAERLAQQSRSAAEACGDLVTAGSAAAHHGRALVTRGEFTRAIDDLTPLYESLSSRTDARPAVRLLAHSLSLAHGFAGDHDSAARYADKALELAEWSGRPVDLIDALAVQGFALSAMGRPFTAVALMRAAIELGQREGETSELRQVYNNLVSILRFRDPRQAAEVAAAGLTAARLAGDRTMLAYLVANHATTLWVCGRWDELLELAADYAEAGRSQLTAELLLDLVVGWVELARSGAVAPPGTEHADNGDPWLRGIHEALASGAADVAGDVAGRHVHGAAAADAVHQSSQIDDDYPMFWMPAIDAAAAAGDVNDVRRIYDQVAQAPPGARAAYLEALLPRASAVLAALEGRDDAVEEGFRTAVEKLTAFGAPFDVACTQLSHAEWLAAQGRQTEAGLLLDAAERCFLELRATRWLERVAAARPTVDA